MKSKEYFKYILYLLSPYKVKIFALTLLMLISGVGNMFVPLIQQKIIDDGITKADMNMLSRLVMLAIVVCLVISVTVYVQNVIQISINCDFNKSLQLKVMAHLLRIKKECLDKEGVLKLSKNADYCVESLSQITGNSVLLLFLEIFKLAGIIIALLWINWKFALFSFTFIPVRLVMTLIISHFSQKYSKSNIQEHQALHKWEEDVFSTIPELKLWNLHKKKNDEYDSFLSKILTFIKKSNLLGAKDAQLGDGLSKIIFNLLYLFAGIAIWGNSLTMGGLLVIISYFSYVLEPVALFSSLSITFSFVKPAIDKFENFMKLPEENEKDRESFEVSDSETTMDLIIQDVSFSHEKHKILKNVNLNILYGQKVALIGENGAGKTTLIDIILRFKEPSQGAILVNNTNIDKYNIDRYREFLGVVTQSPNLFNTTVKNNLTVFDRYTLSYPILSMPLFDFISKLPKGINSEVGSKSTMLSGGEKAKDSSGKGINEATPNIDS